MADNEHDAAAAKADQRRAMWSELPTAVPPEETTPTKESEPPPPDLVADPEHEFVIRHAGL